MKRKIGVITAGAWAVLLLGPAGAAFGQTVYSLPFSNQGGANASQLQTTAAASSPSYSSTAVEDRFFRGAFTPSSTSARLAIQSDDGSDVYVNGVKIVAKKGAGTHWEDPASSLDILNYAFTATGEYCIEIDFRNTAHTAGDVDGVTLYAFDGGGFVRDGIAVWGPEQICIGGSITLNACGSGTINWSSSASSVASVSGSGSSMTVQGLAPGTATITATDSNGKTGSRTVKVVRLWIQPSYYVTCDGVSNTLVLTNAEVTSGASWTSLAL